jgi:hypothetical protein
MISYEVFHKNIEVGVEAGQLEALRQEDDLLDGVGLCRKLRTPVVLGLNFHERLESTNSG